MFSKFPPFPPGSCRADGPPPRPEVESAPASHRIPRQRSPAEILTLGLACLAVTLTARADGADVAPPAPADTNAPATLAIETPLGYPWGIAFGGDRRLYFSDANKQQIFQLDGEGMLKVVAGSGVRGFSGEESEAFQTPFNQPTSLAVGPDGLLYVSDTLNHQVRRIEKDRRVTVVAGAGPLERGAGGYAGDGGPAASARLDSPHGIAFDAGGNLYIADTGNHRIRKVTRPGPDGTITTVAGDGKSGSGGDGRPATDARLNSPMDVALAPDGRLLLSDRYAARIREVMPDGTIRTLAGGGKLPVSDGAPALQVELKNPAAVLYGPNGAIYFSDTGARAVYRLREGKISPLAGAPTGSAGGIGKGGGGTGDDSSGDRLPSPLSGPVELALTTGGRLMIADWSGHRILSVGNDGALRVVAGNGEDGSAPKADGGKRTPATYPLRSAALLPNGNLLFTDSERDRIQELDTQGRLLDLALANGTGPAVVSLTNGALFGPSGLLPLPDGSLLYTESRSHKVRQIGPDGKVTTLAGTGAPGYTGDGRAATRTRLWGPAGLARDTAGNVFIADSMNNRIRKLSPDGTLTTAAGGSDTLLSAPPVRPALNGEGKPDPPPGESRGDTAPGTGDGIGSPATGPAHLKGPMAVAVDPSGRLLVADTGNGLVRRLDGAGAMEVVAGGGTEIPAPGLPARQAQLFEPVALAFAPNGDLAVADARDHRVWVIRPDGILRAVVGSGSEEPDRATGDSPDTLALDRPTGLAYDPQGNLVIVCADRALRITPEGKWAVLADGRTPGWVGEGTSQYEDGTLSDRLKNALQRFREARRPQGLGWKTAPHVTLLGPHEAMISWETDRLASAVLEYGRGSALDHQVPVNEYGTHPFASLRELEPNTQYSYRVRGFRNSDFLREEIVSLVGTFTTRPDGELPAPVLPEGSLLPADTPSDGEGPLEQEETVLLSDFWAGELSPPEVVIRLRRILGLEAAGPNREAGQTASGR